MKDMKKFVEVAHNKKVPKDVQEFFKEVRKGKAVEEMDFVHIVRAMRKEARRQPFRGECLTGLCDLQE